MNNIFKTDSLDKRILSILSENARIPFLEIARECRVSGAAIHQRIFKMKEAGVSDEQIKVILVDNPRKFFGGA